MLRFLCLLLCCYLIISRLLEANSSPLISTCQNDPTCWPKMACNLLKAAKGHVSKHVSQYYKSTDVSQLSAAIFLNSDKSLPFFFLSFPGRHGACVRAYVCVNFLCYWVTSGNRGCSKTGMNSMSPHSTKNTESRHVYAEVDGSRWHHARTPEAGKVHFLNWLSC